jgi:2-hydroxymuconate-semialdehyde hydrolase
MEAKFTDVEGYRVRYWEGGSGFPLLMVHGVGPGTSVVGNFGPVMDRLAEHYHVLGIDLIGFGDSDRKKEPPFFDLDLWLRQGMALVDTFTGGQPCGIAGHSLGGALALKIAGRAPNVSHVLTSSTIGTAYPLNQYLNGFWDLPSSRDELRDVMGNMVFDPVAISEEMLDGRWELLTQDGYGAYFAQMFAGNRQDFIDAAIVTDDEAGAISASVTMIHGRNDKPCPAEQTTLPLAEKLPRADVVLLADCGHNLPREQTEKYMTEAVSLLG